MQKDKRRESVYRDIFFLVDEEEENSSEVYENPELNIVIHYDGRKISTKYNRHKTLLNLPNFYKKNILKLDLKKITKYFISKTKYP